MDHESNDPESRRSVFIGRTSSVGSSVRRHSFSLSGVLPAQADDDIESENVSEAGDIGDRALQSKRHSESGSLRQDNVLPAQTDDDIESENVSEAGDIGDRALQSKRRSESGSLRLDNVLEDGLVSRIQQDTLLHPHGFWSRDLESLNQVSPVSPLPEEIISPLPTDALFQSQDKKRDEEKVLPESLEYVSCLLHLAVFGILGVLTRYILQKLFGPGIAGVTSDQTILYLDLPSNMVGSFLMGWFGVVFKGDISRVSDYLAIGLTTGYLGSVTTFSGWNQKMLDLSVDGKWVLSFLGFFIGLFLAAYSIIFGVETAKGFKWLIRPTADSDPGNSWRVNTLKRQFAAMLVVILMLGCLWALSGTLLAEEFEDGGSRPQLWLACIVAPLGVWIRWFLARLNGRGIGKAGLLKWVPFGTLIANVAAACVMAALATVKRAVNTETGDTIATGIQFGLLGCLSTVSTFIAEFNAMRQSKHPWRAYVYASATMVISFALSIVIYNVPVWTKGY